MSDPLDRSMEGDPIFTFDHFVVDTSNRLLLSDGSPIALTAKAFDILVALVASGGRLLSKQELIDSVWADSFVEEGNLARNISTLRKLLADDVKPYKYIATVPGRGYRFVARVETSGTAPDAQYNIRASANVAAAPQRRTVFTVLAIALVVLTAVGFAVSRFVTQAKTDAIGDKLTFTRLTSSGRISQTALSPDGKLIAFATGERGGQNLVIRQVGVSNELVLVPSIKGYFSNVMFSPDGKLVFYSQFLGDASDGEVHSVPILGGAVQAYPNVKALDFSLAPDGHRFVSIDARTGKGEVDVNINDLDGNEDLHLTKRTFPSTFGGYGQTCDWSPNGTTIAVIVNEVNEKEHYSTILLVDPITGAEENLTPMHWNSLNSAEWVSDNSGVIVTGNATGNEPSQIWLIGVDGSVRRLTNDLNNYYSASANAAGHLIVGRQETTTSGIWESAKSDTAGDAIQLTSGSGKLAPVTVLPDGRFVFRARTVSGPDLWSVTADGGEKRPLTTDGSVDRRGICSTSDGRYVVYPSNKGGETALWRLDTTDSTSIPLTSGIDEVYPACTPDNKSVVFQRSASAGQKTSLWRVSIDGGETARVTDYFAMRPTVSPDGKNVAFFFMDENSWRVGLVSVNGGKVLKKLDIPTGMVDRIARWDPDGQSLLLIANSGGVGNIIRLPIDGRPAERITNFSEQEIEDLYVSPTGGVRAYSRSTRISDVFVATN